MAEGKRFVDRRKGPDIVVKFLKAASFFIWAIIIVIIIIMNQAKPQVENFFSRLLNVPLRESWDIDLLRYAFYLSDIMLVFSIFAFILNMGRHRRKTDKYSKSIIIMIIFSLGVILFYLSKL